MGISWKSEEELSAVQLRLEDLARKMCLKSDVPPEVVATSSDEATVNGMPSGELLKGSLPMPHPSLSERYMEGSLAFVTPFVMRDLPQMVNECRRQGLRVGKGCLLVRKHLHSCAFSALKP